MKFDAKPDIPYLRKLFRDLYHAQGCATSAKLWDWDTIPEDYFNGEGDASSANDPIISKNNAQPIAQTNLTRPSTAIAINGDERILVDEFDESNNRSGPVSSRPNTAGVTSSRQQSTQQQHHQQEAISWGYPRPSGGEGVAQSDVKDPRVAIVSDNNDDRQGR